MPRIKQSSWTSPSTSSPSRAGGPTRGNGEIVVEHAPTAEQIQVRAYELYLERHGENGDALQDWLQAEAELKGAGRRSR